MNLKECVINQLILDQKDRMDHFRVVKKKGKCIDFLSIIVQIETKFTNNMLSFLRDGSYEESIPNILEELLSTYSSELDYYMFTYKGEVAFEEAQMANDILITNYRNENAILALANVSMYNYQHCKMLYQHALFVHTKAK